MREEATGKVGKPTEQRNKPRRPRDLLGRPLAWGATNQLELPDFDALPLVENHRLACLAFDEGRYFPAHEGWETAWKQSKDTEDAEFFKGLSQMGAGYVHLLRGNVHGAQKLLTRAASRLAPVAAGHQGVDAPALASRCTQDAEAVERGDLQPGPDALFGVDAPRVATAGGAR